MADCLGVRLDHYVGDATSLATGGYDAAVTEIAVTAMGPGHFGVQVTEGATTTSHRVSVPEGLLEDLGLPGADEEEFVRQSFEFLLAREPAGSILSSFSLEVISSYFEGCQLLPGTGDSVSAERKCHTPSS